MKLKHKTNRFFFEVLEPRRLLSSLIVTSAADPAGPLVAGTLRYAVNQANQHARLAQSDTITFNTDRMGSSTITLLQGELVLNAIGPGALVGLVAIDGGGTVTLSGNDLTRVFLVHADARAALTGLTIRDGHSTNIGGGVLNYGDLTVSNSTLSDNSATQDAGGIFNYGTLTVSNTTFSGNSAIEVGGIDNRGTLTMRDSTLSGNHASFDVGGINNHNGGYLTVINCTISGNSGGGINNDRGGTLTMTNCTIFGNSGGGVFNADVGSHVPAAMATIKNSIIAGDTHFDVLGDFLSQGHNLIGESDFSTGFTAPGDRVGRRVSPIDPGSGPIDPKLGPLQDNGGPTQTMALLPGSPAFDAGSNALAVDDSGNPLRTDQRGLRFERVFGAAVDIGAFEEQPQPTPEVTFYGHSQPHLLFILAGDSLTFSGDFADPKFPGGHTVSWNFGDGNSTTSSFAPGESASFTADHAFAAPGTYGVTLTVTADDGVVGTTQTTVIVQAPADATGSLLSYVQSLAQLNTGQQNSLESTLNGVIAALDRGNTTTAKNMLGAFDNKVKARFGAGLLTGAQNALLLSAVDAIREEIG